MALEDVVLRLARAVESQGEASAVAEIIRQRESAIRERDRWQRDAEFYKKERNQLSALLGTERRRVISLRVVIRKLNAQRGK